MKIDRSREYQKRGLYQSHENNFGFENTIVEVLQQRRDTGVDVSRVVYTCVHFLEELPRLGSDPCEFDDPLHILLVGDTPGCMGEQRDSHVSLERVDIHILFLRDGHLGLVRSEL